MNKIIERIHERVNQAMLEKREKPRTYLGASILGTECARQLWYTKFDSKNIDNPNVLMKFAVGTALEPIIVEFFNKAGYQLFCTGENQIRFEDGEIAGSGDGVIKGIEGDEETPYLLEIKTANSFYFKQFVKDGISANEKYKGQVNIYMKEFKLKKCLFVVMNKDTQELHMEIVQYDEYEAVRLLERGKHILTMSEPPERQYPKSNYFKCKFCGWNKTCWSDE
jgi:CRISPR/Cas system-associated exonuclease Cas4 (RecB family)